MSGLRVAVPLLARDRVSQLLGKLRARNAEIRSEFDVVERERLLQRLRLK
jgi:hypothetical protein